MGMIRRADLDTAARAARVMDLGDLRARGEALVAAANAEAERIVREAHAERDRLLAGAREEGRRAGLEEGRAQGRAEGREAGAAEARQAAADRIAALAESWAGALDAFESRRDEMLACARTEVVRLAAEIATRVTRRAVQLDPATVAAQMEAVLATVARPTRLTLRVHPDDLALAQDELPDLLARFDLCRHADLLTDASLARGSCVATTDDGGRIDADVDAQLDRLVAAMLPGESVIRLERPARGDAA